MDEDLELVTPVEMREEVLLQLLAVFVRRFGGEVTISKREFDMVEGLSVVAQTTIDQLKLKLEEEYEIIYETGDHPTPEG